MELEIENADTPLYLCLYTLSLHSIYETICHHLLL